MLLSAVREIVTRIPSSALSGTFSRWKKREKAQVATSSPIEDEGSFSMQSPSPAPSSGRRCPTGRMRGSGHVFKIKFRYPENNP